MTATAFRAAASESPSAPLVRACAAAAARIAYAPVPPLDEASQSIAVMVTAPTALVLVRAPAPAADLHPVAHRPLARPPRVASRRSTVRSYGTDGGRVLFGLGEDSAKPVSATPAPAPDWSMQVRTDSTWIRVNFSQDGGPTVSVFCTWNGHPPQVEIV
ncbi:hypothetical protein ACFVT1_25670 [Streptomyces sp. NPDC057963]|uniref:hypothetical protein n=1 Tax=Streptomyces sp. NPDC057963 TaxID=3346290 RepID=UPI0036E132CB